MEQQQQKRQRSLLSWVSKTTATATATAKGSPSSAPAPSSSSRNNFNFVDGPPGLLSLDADSHVLYLPGLLGEGEEEREEGKEDGKEEGRERKNPTLFHRLREEVDWLQRDVTVFNRTTPQRRLVAYHSCCCREDRLRPYTYSGLTLEPQSATPAVMEVLSSVEAAAAERCEVSLPARPSAAASASPASAAPPHPPSLFNSCLLNLYRGGKDCMGWHADDEAVYYSSSSSSLPSASSASSAGIGDEEIVIASASFGERRDFYLRPKPGAAAAAKSGGRSESGAATASAPKKVRYRLGGGDVLLMLGQTQRRFQHSVPARANLEGRERINLTFRWNVQCGGEAPRVRARV